MKVRELIAELQKLNPDHEVVMAADADGNGYALLDGTEDGHTYAHEHVWPTEHEDQYELYEGGDGVEAVVLYPCPR